MLKGAHMNGGETAATPGFRRVVVGVDGSRESVVALRQAVAMAEPDASLVLVDAIEVVVTETSGWTPVAVPMEAESPMREAALRVLQDAAASAASGRAVMARVKLGPAGEVLLQEAREADLVAVGLHGHTRADGIVNRRAASVLLHQAACPVLIARVHAQDAPASIVAGVDGSDLSLAALDVARAVALRTGASLTAVAASGGHPIDLDRIAEETSRRGVRLQVDPAAPAKALVDAGADLVVVGSRGLRGVRALGSVSESVGHRAASSVLVVRGNPDRAGP
jgi:nucleotide-binding universal stress UspA family protein